MLNWRFEKQRDQRTRRRELLASWREGVDAWEREHPSSPGAATATLMRPDGRPAQSITYCDWFQTLTPHLTIEVDPMYIHQRAAAGDTSHRARGVEAHLM